MKNTLTALALAVFTAGIAQAQTAAGASASITKTPVADLSVSGKFAWAGKNVYLGKQRSDEAGLIQSTVTVEGSVPGFAGVSAYVSYYNADNFERSINIGGKTDWTNVGTADFGVSRTNTAGQNAGAATLALKGYTQADSGREVYVGVTAKAFALAPSAYLYYNTDLKQANLVVSAQKTFEGKDLGVPGFELETRAYLGLVDSKASRTDVANSYVYFGASADLVRQIGAGAKVGLGLSYAYNTDGQVVETAGSAVWLKAYANFKF